MKKHNRPKIKIIKKESETAEKDTKIQSNRKKIKIEKKPANTREPLRPFFKELLFFLQKPIVAYFLIGIVVLALLLSVGYVVHPYLFNSDTNKPPNPPPDLIVAENPIKQEIRELERISVLDSSYIQMDSTFSGFINHLGVPYSDAQKLIQLAAGLPIAQLQAKDKVTLYRIDNRLGKIKGIKLTSARFKTVYYWIVLQENVRIEEVAKKTEQKERITEVMIDSTLIDAVLDANLHRSLLDYLDDALKWSVDLHHLAPGDKFSAVFDEIYIDGKFVEIKALKAVRFIHKGEAHTAFLHKSKYYDRHAMGMDNTFLKSPIKYGGYISSRYNLNRFHPVYKKVKAHLGTDFAAAEGTPIIATGKGRVTIAGHKEANGNYIKIQHDNTYTTQYLHMQKFAEGIKVGSQVSQGQVIGYVGQTGAATGSHVCYRFWKNGKQIDPINANVSSRKAMPIGEREAYLEKVADLVERVGG